MKKKKETRFKIERKGYSISEVEKYISDTNAEYEKAGREQRERIAVLSAKIGELDAIIMDYRAREEGISSAFIAANEKAEKLTADVRLRYGMELERLRLFREKWTGVYAELKERYRFDKDALNMESVAVQTKLEIERVLVQEFSLAKGGEESDAEKQFQSESDRLSKSDVAIEELKNKLLSAGKRKAEKDKQSVAFSLEEATHPTESLEELCAYLGLGKKE